MASQSAAGGALKEKQKKEEEEAESSSGEYESETETETESEEEVEREPWRHSIFGCFDHGVAQCCAMFICGRCTYANAINTAFHGGCGCYVCCCIFGDLFTCCNRAKLRAKYDLEPHNLGGALGDCITVTCCSDCARCQAILEVETREGLLIGPCAVKSGNPQRTRAANTGGPMRRNKILPVDANAQKSEKEPLNEKQGSQENDDSIARLKSSKREAI